ncbi:Gfo/Idh/MocA family oxidoreductase [Candidatus Gracilibacteria bacterium]|nr:Gfo/Idh/MocA family oxidoreductase [Candidatus Gracilibacteria bacterium]
MPAKLRAAVIGVGSMGKNHARIYADLEGVELVAVADPEPSLCNAVAQKYRCTGYADHREMLAREQIDLVSVVVPTRFHYAVALDVIEAGVPLLIEKPNRSDGRAGPVADRRSTTARRAYDSGPYRAL